MSITPADIAEAMGRPSPSSAEIGQWSIWIRDAHLILRVGDGAHVGGLGDLSLLDQDTLDYVVREAVIAHLRRPDDATQVDISVDDGRVSRTYSSAAGRVTIRPEWWAMLSSADDSGGAFTIGPASNGPGFPSCLTPRPVSSPPWTDSSWC